MTMNQITGVSNIILKYAFDFEVIAKMNHICEAVSLMTS